MEVNRLIGIVGILVVIVGAYIAARGFFKEKNIEIERRTHMSFGNEEHFKTMIFQKYNEIFGFCLIIVGSIIQLISVLELSASRIHINNFTFLIILIISTIIFISLIKLTIDKYISKKVDIVGFYNCIKTIKNYTLIDSEQTRKATESSYIYAKNNFLEIYNKRYKGKSNLEIEEKVEDISRKFQNKFKSMDKSIENFKRTQERRKQEKV